MRTFEYVRASTLDEAPALVDGEHTPENGTRFLAGGTDLLTLMKADVVQPSLLVDIKRTEGLPRGIEETKDGLTLGALVTLGEIERHPGIAERYRALMEAVSLAATPQLRNMATIGGNLLQRPRCWYYRSSLFHCWLKGGAECHARDGENQHHALFGESPCVAVHPSDAASALIALGATVRLRGSAGERTLSVEELFAEPTEERRTETVIRPDELLLDVRLPALAGGARSTYLKAMDRKVWAFALVGVAAMLRLEHRNVAEARIVLSGVAPIPWRAHAAEQELIGQDVTPERIACAAERALEGARPLEHNGYKVPLAQNLVRRALTDLAG
ncbi:MAG TPA: xanthine dehydrogenase family protein subunit M [Chloroflexota bacterium]|nr:xanthine dehydrogenase family protein subunit M [Chloroflexota bacterium]